MRQQRNTCRRRAWTQAGLPCHLVPITCCRRFLHSLLTDTTKRNRTYRKQAPEFGGVGIACASASAGVTCFRLAGAHVCTLICLLEGNNLWTIAASSLLRPSLRHSSYKLASHPPLMQPTSVLGLGCTCSTASVQTRDERSNAVRSVARASMFS